MIWRPPPHLIRLFRSHLNATPMRLLWHKRVERGAELLRDTELSVSQIAYQLGFSTPFHFSRLVKEHFGCSSTMWRKQQWRVEAEK